MYRIEVHIKKSNVDVCNKHFCYNAKMIEIKDNTVYFITQDNLVKVFNMDRVSYIRVHKLHWLGTV